MPRLRALTMWELFRGRLESPHVGDSVEVAWRGKFRLEAQDVYQGLAWWIATVVERGARYKIHYPGWESRWDEWVDRRRLRWGSDKDITTQLNPKDRVELWCCGFNVPGAWLETSIKKVRRDKYAVHRSQGAGTVWVDRDRLRPRRRKLRSTEAQEEADNEEDLSQSLVVSMTQCVASSRCSVM